MEVILVYLNDLIGYFVFPTFIDLHMLGYLGTNIYGAGSNLHLKALIFSSARLLLQNSFFL